MKFRDSTAATVVEDLRRFADYMETESFVVRKMIAQDVNVFLDSLLGEDFFGTEGQCDPRGDHRG